MPPPDGRPAEICDNEFEDDGDGFIDCDDPDCVDDPWCAPEAICNDGEDNDHDHYVDCDDTNCAANPACLPESHCSDGVDDDLDGDIDCADDDCAIFCLAGCVDGETLVTVPATGLPQTVDPDDVTVDFPVVADGWVAGAAVHFTIDHTFPADLDISLESPAGGPTVDLTSDNGGTGENYTDTYIGDGATTPITSGSAPFTGRFQPEEPLSKVTGMPATGDWHVLVHDDFAGESGTVQSMDLYVCVCNGTDGCETLRACADGADNDADGLTDCEDDDCATAIQCTPETACADGIDNNEDGQTDCQDPDCTGVGGCELPEATCDDGFDNDGDGTLDCADSDCVPTAYCQPEADCSDGTDDDGDGLADCLDVGCNGIDGCELGHEVSCFDAIDNDGDGQTDCADSECAALLQCIVGCPAGSIVTDGVSTDLPKPLPDVATTTDTIALSHPGLVQKVAVKIDANHTFDGDLAISLGAPGGTVSLSSHRGSGGDNYTNTVFVDSASTAISAGTPPFTGSFRPEATLGALAGSAVTGNWTLTVQDTTGGDSGTLNYYEVLVCQCDPASGDCEFGPACRNGTDDDGDGLVDCQEASCATDASCQPETQCNDHVDNDFDTHVDCLDSDCNGVNNCQFGTETACGDAFDNDADGLVDCLDADCDGVGSCQFGTETSCNDGLDNDADTHADCADTDCASAANCLPEVDCRNGIDDDGDGFTDCLDAQCNGVQGCELGTELTCTDGLDNDGDGLTDCADSNCANALACIAGCPAGMEISDVVATDTPIAIPDNTTINSHVTLAGTGKIQKVLVKMNATHTFDGDLAISLVAPTATVSLSNRHGSGGDNYTNTIFNDAAATAIASGTPPYTGQFRPDAALSTLNGANFAGDWQLRVQDNASGDTGTLSTYELLVCHCDPASGNCEFGASCRNGTDDDADGQIDCADPNCATDPFCIPEAVCNDHVDNDLDSLTDCLDPNCNGVSGCELGTEVSCGDNFDNDGDTHTDCFDTDCAGVPACQIELVCNDGIDNDGNGLIDCADAACAGGIWCTAETDCADGLDNDGDGATDCADVGCNGLQGCVLAPEVGSACADAIDNDGDHQADCADPGCALWCAIPSCPAGSHKRWFQGTNVPQPILDNNPVSPTVSPVNLTVPGLITQAALRLDITHTFDADIDAFLYTPYGPYEITTDNGSSGDNFTRTVFVDSATTPITQTTTPAVAPYTGSYRPEWPLAGLANAPATGEFDLSVADDAGGDTGTLVNYELLVCECDFASGSCEFGPYACRNGVDDDGNGVADCAEPACSTDPVCATPPPARESVCNDGTDDDADGQTDCADSDCSWACNAIGSVCTGGKRLVTYRPGDLPKTIPTTTPFQAVSPFRVTQTGTISRAAVKLNVAHLNDADLSVFLSSPAGSFVELTSGNGGTGDNYTDTVFVDTATGVIGTTGFNTAPFTGKYRPESPLGVVAGESSSGVWTAQLRDVTNLNGGTWNDVSLGLCVVP